MRLPKSLFCCILFCCPLAYAFSWKCLGCRAGVEVLHFLYEGNVTASEILKAANYVCRHFADTDSFVCKGITTQFKDEFLYVLGKLVLSPRQLCGLLLRDCGTPLDPFDTNWTVPLPPKPPASHENDQNHFIKLKQRHVNNGDEENNDGTNDDEDGTNDENGTINNDGTIDENGTIDEDGTNNNDGTIDENGTIDEDGTIDENGTTDEDGTVPIRAPRPFRILQLSDIHVDPAYMEGAEADCAEPVCCLKSVPSPKRRAGHWGTAANCDIPARTVDNLLQHINRSHELDLVLLSGDYIDHRDWAYTRQGHRSAIANLSALLQRHLPAVPIFWTLGNHEGVPVNAFAPHFAPAKFRPQWMYETVLREGHRTARGKLPPSVDESAIYRGSYAVNLEPGLKLISLNNGYCDRTNMFVYINQTDPDGALSWLVDQLWEAEKAAQAVYILAHIPPGDDECLESWSRNYYRIVVRFANSIRAQFFGHTHFDSFSLFYADMNDARSEPVSMLFTGPSVTTFQSLHPAYRIYTVEPTTWEVLDYETHFLNLSNTRDDRPPNWEFLYSAKSEYALEGMNAREWNALAGRIESEPAMARRFNRNFVRRDDVPCDAKCLAKRVCSIRAAHHNEKALCGGKSGGSGSSRRKPHKNVKKKMSAGDTNRIRRPTAGGADEDREWFMAIWRRMISEKMLKWVRDNSTKCVEQIDDELK